MNFALLNFSLVFRTLNVEQMARPGKLNELSNKNSSLYPFSLNRADAFYTESKIYILIYESNTSREGTCL